MPGAGLGGTLVGVTLHESLCSCWLRPERTGSRLSTVFSDPSAAPAAAWRPRRRRFGTAGAERGVFARGDRARPGGWVRPSAKAPPPARLPGATSPRRRGFPGALESVRALCALKTEGRAELQAALRGVMVQTSQAGGEPPAAAPDLASPLGRRPQGVSAPTRAACRAAGRGAARRTLAPRTTASRPCCFASICSNLQWRARARVAPPCSALRAGAGAAAPRTAAAGAPPCLIEAWWAVCGVRRFLRPPTLVLRPLYLFSQAPPGAPPFLPHRLGPPRARPAAAPRPASPAPRRAAPGGAPLPKGRRVRDGRRGGGLACVHVSACNRKRGQPELSTPGGRGVAWGPFCCIINTVGPAPGPRSHARRGCKGALRRRTGARAVSERTLWVSFHTPTLHCPRRPTLPETWPPPLVGAAFHASEHTFAD
jgi:hypothetical protein